MNVLLPIYFFTFMHIIHFDLTFIYSYMTVLLNIKRFISKGNAALKLGFMALDQRSEAY